MASNYYILRCESMLGTFTLTELNFDSTVEDLRVILLKLTAVKRNALKIFVGYPPKLLAIENGNLMLTELNILSGDTIIIEIKKDEPGDALEEAALGAQRNDIRAALRAEENYFKDEVMNHPAIMMRYVVPSNSSCLFTSVNFTLTNGTGKEDPNFSRKIIAYVVRNNPDKYNEVFLGKTNRAYSAWIRDPNNWGGAIELSILSEHFEIEIVAIDILSLTAHRFGENNDYQNRVFLVYDGIHYDPLVLIYKDYTQTIFPTSDQGPMDMAMELAREARSNNLFSDEANISFFCKSCKREVKGVKEADEHKLLTGHDKFY
ncbi:ubiquitin thioesterase OTU1 [Nephila pilipes]|uniref:Ubiquitin thioesterase OTU n=1 Tax=Nephila pilipes TaxID=299642 RepID=A0A8X6TUU3_NEPPI|nr:ubiquitin thioesterase OTU1 [Nephila pilipes]